MKTNTTRSLLVLLALMVGSIVSLHAQVSWNSVVITNAGPYSWTNTTNWNNTGNPGSAPAATESQQVVFDIPETIPNQTYPSFTVLLDTAGNQTLEGGLLFANHSYWAQKRQITFDLNGKSLILNGGTLSWWRNWSQINSDNTIRFEGAANSVFQSGSSGKFMFRPR